ncbi:11749_t:CDS:2 [Rhizophagus irregularis]|nr:11749_t:CDS:2 [Rhizophagus irregularis]
MMTDDTTNIATEEPVVHENLISRRVWYYVFGEWSCLGLDCENKWGHKRTKIKLSKYKDRVDANDLNDTERVGQKCRKCSSNNSKLVKYSPLPEEDIKPPVHEHLIWKHDDKEEWYRVFGTWDCDNENCKPGWSSAHTYILLSKYRDEIPAANLQRDDHYWGQDCKSESCSTFRGTLKDYRPLRRGLLGNKPQHQGTFCHNPSTPSGQQFFITFNDNSSNNSNSIPKNNVPRNNDVPKNNVQINAPFSSTSSTTISVRRIKTPGQNNVIRKQETVSGTQTTHFRKSTHRLELVSSRMRLQQQQLQQLQQQQKQQQKQQQLQQQQQQQQQQQLQQQLHQQQLQQQLHQHQMQQQLQQQQLQHQLQQHVVPKKLYEEFDPKKADLVLLKYTKEMLKKYIEEEPSGILRNGECTWSETEPYIREVHFPKFRKYLNDRGIQAQDIIISKCLKDLHISRRDLWNKKQRKLRELRSKEQFDNVEAQSPRSDGYVPFKRK